MATLFKTFDGSPFGAFVRSPFGARNGEAVEPLEVSVVFGKTNSGSPEGTVYVFGGPGAPLLPNVELGTLSHAGADCHATDYDQWGEYYMFAGGTVSQNAGNNYGQFSIRTSKGSHGHRFAFAEFTQAKMNFTAIAVDRVNHYIFVGSRSRAEDTELDPWLDESVTWNVRKFFSNMEEVTSANWPVDIDFNASQSHAAVTAMAVLSDGTVWVAADYQDGDDEHYLITHLDADGNILDRVAPWTNLGDPDAWGVPTKMVVDTEDNLYISLNTNRPKEFSDLGVLNPPLVVKLDAGGSLLWEWSPDPFEQEPDVWAYWKATDLCLFDSNTKIAVCAYRVDYDQFYPPGPDPTGYLNPPTLHCLSAGGGSVLWDKFYPQHADEDGDRRVGHRWGHCHADPNENHFFACTDGITDIGDFGGHAVHADAFTRAGASIYGNKRITSILDGNRSKMESVLVIPQVVQERETPPCDFKIHLPDEWLVTLPALTAGVGETACELCEELAGLHRFQRNPIDVCSFVSDRNPQFVPDDEDDNCLNVAYGLLLFTHRPGSTAELICELQWQNAIGTVRAVKYRASLANGFHEHYWEIYDSLILDLDVGFGSGVDSNICQGWPDTIEITPNYE